MNVIELGAVMAGLGLSASAGVVVGRSAGVGMGVLAAVAVAAGWLALIVGGERVLGHWHRRFPLRPRCATGRCSSDDYSFLGESEGRARFECRCGRRYLREGQRFFREEDNGALVPFMRKQRGVWRPDEAR